MKHLFIILIQLFLVTKLTAQQTEKPVKPPYPNSIIDAGIGAGTNYGLIGAKAVIGYKGNGLLLGGGLFGYQVGLQGSYKWLFANVSYGAYNFVTDGFTGNTYSLYGVIAIVGGKINLIKSKKLFLEIGVGYAGGDGIKLYPSGYEPINGPTATIGLNYRFVLKKKKKSD